MITFTANIQQQKVDIHVSPELTKIHYEYMPVDSQELVIVYKTIDYTHLYAYDVNFVDKQKYLEMALVNNSDLNSTNISSNHSLFIVLEDQYVVVRNDYVAH